MCTMLLKFIMYVAIEKNVHMHMYMQIQPHCIQSLSSYRYLNATWCVPV